MKELISVITPAIREDELALNKESLERQTFRDFKWYVCSPFEYSSADLWIQDPPKSSDDFMGENKAYNELFKSAKGQLIVTLNDSIYMKQNALEKFWEYYQNDPQSCYCFMGDHYEKVIHGAGYRMTYKDVRRSQYVSPISGTTLINFDACCSSIPKTAIERVGQIDPVWDKFCCWGIRAFMFEVREAGYTLNISKESEYVGQKHTKEYDPTEIWNQKFQEGEVLFNKLYGTP